MADGSSPNPYIRTYAKDVAELSGKGPVPTEISEPTPPVAVEDADAKVKEADRAEVLSRLRERAAKDPVHQSTMLPPTLATPTPLAESTGEEAPVPVLPVPAESVPPPVPATFIPEPAISEVAPHPVEASAPAPEFAHASLIPQAAFTPTPTVEPTPILEVAPTPTPTPTPTPVVVPPPPVPTPPEESTSPIHTYTSDFADRIDSKEASAFSVLAAQSDDGALATRTLPKKSHRSRDLIIVMVSVILIAIAGAGAFAAYRYVSSHAAVAIAPLVPSLVFADDRQALSGEGATLLQALATSADTALPEGQVRVVYLTESTTTADGKTTTIPLAGGQLIGALQLTAPDILLRNIAPESTVGIVHAGPETRAFFIMKVLSYERTFAGMLQWEGAMEQDLSALYPEYPAPAPGAPTVATTTTVVKGKTVVSTTTIPAAPVITVPPRFVDEVASNHDVRALKDGQGRTILLYGYKDKETLVIARDEAAFAELLNRLSATKQQ